MSTTVGARSATAPLRVLDGALSWLTEHLDHFNPFEDGELSGLCEVPLAELSILTLCGLRCAATPPWDFGLFLDHIESISSNPVYQQRPFREPETLVSHVIATAALDCSGRAVDLDRVGLSRLVQASTLPAPALAPHRMMELRHALDLVRIRHRLPSYRTLFRRSFASHTVNPIFMSRPEAYVLTHVVFYATDLGNCAPRGIAPLETAALSRRVVQLLAMSICEGNWDLTAEFLFSWYLLAGSRHLPLAQEAWRCLSSAQRADGSVPGPRADPDKAAEADVGAYYHTTLVCALAALGYLNAAASDHD
ncbi:MAG: DUF6895 family protein [Gaiellaceae bacterium]